MLPGLVIRAARVADAMGIAHVQVDTHRIAYRGIMPDAHLASLSYDDRAARWAERFQSYDHLHVALVAEDTARVVGFAIGGPERDGVAGYTGELYGLYLLQAYQRRGLGRELVRAFAQELVTKGMLSMLVWALAENPARAFYEKLGGQYVADKIVQIGGADLREVAYGWHDARVLLELGSHSG